MATIANKTKKGKADGVTKSIKNTFEDNITDVMIVGYTSVKEGIKSTDLRLSQGSTC